MLQVMLQVVPASDAHQRLKEQMLAGSAAGTSERAEVVSAGVLRLRVVVTGMVHVGPVRWL